MSVTATGTIQEFSTIRGYICIGKPALVGEVFVGNAIPSGAIGEREIKGSIPPTGTLVGALYMPQSVGGEFYDGPYEVIPTDIEQVLAVSDKTMKTEIRVAPIPSNYGRISWNGSTLTVS